MLLHSRPLKGCSNFCRSAPHIPRPPIAPPSRSAGRWATAMRDGRLATSGAQVQTPCKRCESLKVANHFGTVTDHSLRITRNESLTADIAFVPQAQLAHHDRSGAKTSERLLKEIQADEHGE